MERFHIVLVFFSKHKNKILFVNKLLNLMTWLILKASEMIFLALGTSAASMTMAASKTSTALMTSKAFFSQKASLPGTKMTKNGAFLWIGSLKIHIFTDIWHFFGRRLLRPANITFLKIDG
jgi:hypothetical protein